MKTPIWLNEYTIIDRHACWRQLSFAFRDPDKKVRGILGLPQTENWYSKEKHRQQNGSRCIDSRHLICVPFDLAVLADGSNHFRFHFQASYHAGAESNLPWPVSSGSNRRIHITQT